MVIFNQSKQEECGKRGGEVKCMKKVRMVLCDDLPNDLAFYESLSRRLAEKYGVEIKIKKYISGDDIMFDIEDSKLLKAIDMMFLNINMPGPNGIAVAEAARKNGYGGLIVFLTASEKHYEPAFDVKGFNYITKNEMAAERFEKVFRLALDEIQDDGKEAIVLSGGGQYRQIRVASIRYFEVVINVITVHYGENETFEFVSTLNKLENQLENRGFYRAQRGYLVNMNYVFKLTYENILMKDGTKIPVGRKYYKGLKEIVAKHNGKG